MPDHHEQYCRGCKCTVDESEFQDEDQQYKQCGRCRARLHHRRRSNKTVVCQCGRQVLATSLRDHRRTLYHEQHMALLVDDKQPVPKDLLVNKLPQPAPRKATPAIDHPKPVIVGHVQRAQSVATGAAELPAAVHVKPAAADQAKATVKPAAAGQAKPVATGRAEPLVQPSAIPADASGMLAKASTQAPRPLVMKAPAAPVSMPPASHSFAMLKQLQSRS
jgi:hypothetical protein